MPEDTLKKGLADCYITEGISKKNGKPYSVLNIEFENGYTLEHFLTNEQKFIVGNIISTF